MFLDEFYSLTEYIHLNFKQFIICGDLNIHFNKSADQTTIKFCDILNTFSLSQSVHDATHRLGNTLDLVIHDPECINVSNVSVDDQDNISDHYTIHFDVCCEIKKSNKKEISYRNINNIVDSNFLTDLTSDSIDFAANADHNNFCSSLQLFNNTFANTINRHAPIITKIIPDK